MTHERSDLDGVRLDRRTRTVHGRRDADAAPRRSKKRAVAVAVLTVAVLLAAAAWWLV